MLLSLAMQYTSTTPDKDTRIIVKPKIHVDRVEIRLVRLPLKEPFETSFGRCLREMVESVLRASERGVPTFGISDNDTTPIAMHCDAYLVAHANSPSFTGSYVAPMALTNTIIVACSHLQPKRALAVLSRTEEEYRTGSHWYQEPLRRNKSQSDGDHTTGGNHLARSRKKQ